jgi:hypothetical protein
MYIRVIRRIAAFPMPSLVLACTWLLPVATTACDPSPSHVDDLA